MKYNSKYNVLFKVAPPVEWSGLVGIIHVSYEYGYSYEVEESEVKHLKPFVYNGRNYKALLKKLSIA